MIPMPLSVRMAWRDAWRAKGRSILVLILIALPVAAMTIIATIEHNFDSNAVTMRALGNAEAKISWNFQTAVRQDPVVPEFAEPLDGDRVYREEAATTDEISAELPDDWKIIEFKRDSTDVIANDRVGQIELIGVDLTEPMTEGMFTVLEGSPPSRGEVAVSSTTAERFQLDIGDTIDTGGDRPSVVAILEDPGDLTRDFILTVPEAVDKNGNPEWLVDAPTPITWDDVLTLNDKGITVLSKAVIAAPPPSPIQLGNPDEGTRDLVMVAGIAALLILEVVLLAAPAFTISAKRRVRDFGLLSVNGATPAQVRRTVLAGGIVLSTVAVVVGIGFGLAASLAGLPILEDLYRMRSVDFGAEIWIVALAAVLALLSGLLATLVPAFTASRQSALANLSGRRGTLRSRKRWLVLGGITVVAGSAMLWVSLSTRSTILLPLGIILVELGLVLCTPSLVGLVSKSGRYLPLSARLALRNAGRNRTAAAPAISAVMAVVAAGVALSMGLFNTLGYHDQYRENLAEGTTAVEIWLSPELTESVLAGTETDQVMEAEQVIEDLLIEELSVDSVGHLYNPDCNGIPDIDTATAWCQMRARPAPDKACPYETAAAQMGIQQLSAEEQLAAVEHPNCTQTTIMSGRLLQGIFVIADPEHVTDVVALDSDEAAAATKVLAQGGIVVGDPALVDDGMVTVEVLTFNDGATDTTPTRHSQVTAPGYAMEDAPTDLVLMSQDAGSALNISFKHRPYVVTLPDTVPSQAQLDSLNASLTDAGLSTPGGDETPISVRVDTTIIDETEAIPTEVLIITLVTGLLALAATAVATTLAMSESRRDLTTLGTIGAAPGVRRRLALSQAAVMSGLGAVLGIVAGIGFTTMTLIGENAHTADRYPLVPAYPLDIPWVTVAVVLVAVPAMAMLGAGLLTRSRIPSERRIAT